MKFFLISDNTDTQMGMRIAGVEGVVVHTSDEVNEALDKAAAYFRRADSVPYGRPGTRQNGFLLSVLCNGCLLHG